MNDHRPVRTHLRRAAGAAAVTCAATGALAGAHLLALLAAGIWGRKQSPPQLMDDVNLAVVVPAHDEEEQIAQTLRSIQASSYPAANLRIVVVADNCTDRTAAVARAQGVEVWERLDPVRRGKGYALEWAFSRLCDEQTVDAVCVIDADCEISANLLHALAARLGAGAEAVQAPYLISNPDASDAAALRWAGFALFNVVRPLGRHRLGLSSGLFGTGMAFSRRLLLRSPWSAFSFAEDREQHMRWVLDRARVEFAPEAQVRSPAPNTVAGSKAQMSRWDSGRGALAARLTPKLLSRALRTGDVTALDAALEPVLPPQSVLLAINVAGIVSARLAGSQRLILIAAGGTAAQAAYVVGGLVALKAPTPVWRALLVVPRFVARRAAGLLGSLVGRGPSEWERTQRRAAPSRAELATPPTPVQARVRSPVL